MEHQTQANTNLTHSFANSVWKQFDQFVARSASLSIEELKLRSELEQLQRITKQQMIGTAVVKVKIYNLDGVTVFSTEPKQIGSDKSHNLGFLQAKSGTTISEITFRNEFYALEGIISDRNLIASYIPVFADDHSVKAVFEIYSDVTSLIEHMEASQYKIILGVLLAMSVLYIFLYLIVKRADNILKGQELLRKESERKIRHQAYHDSLTGLPNRNFFSEQIEEAVKRAKRHNKDGALIFLDLDRFKLINDSLGHDAGDQLLRITAARLQKSLREADQVFRLSGDEFTIILEDLDQGIDASNAARRILELMAESVLLNDHEVIINISIGITTFPKSGISTDTLLKEADAAMYRAKELGHNRYEFYVHDMNTFCHERLVLETDLQHAMQNAEFVLYYQAKVDSISSKISSVEALIRWNHPKQGLMLPNKFIPLLEDTGLIHAVGDWILMTACQQGQSWIDDGIPATRISVNISAKQFRNPSLVKRCNLRYRCPGLTPGILNWN
jgi:diguanylate cyclase (GGDEF)-like protein